MATSSRRESGPVLLLSSLSPSDRFYSHAPPCSTTVFATSTPTRATVASRASSVRLSPGRSFSARTGQSPKRACSCSPTNHPGSFRCGQHKGFGTTSAHAPSPSNRMQGRRSVMTNSVVKRALAVLTRPLSHSQSRRANFKPQPSGLSVMSKANL
ncbi:unnamed protein product [Arabis nemorensis]|uniref:Serine-rich protein-like protein n=1 Tax=Arabis nemorensis TaxID=586526 RepID=A0A565AVM5_9BRAS|nr:unnamed protein product [Arabis nemorensis]